MINSGLNGRYLLQSFSRYRLIDKVQKSGNEKLGGEVFYTTIALDCTSIVYSTQTVGRIYTY